MSFLSNRTIQEALPAGVVFPFAGSVAPDGWLLCNGSAISRTTYARLFASIGVVFGAGDGTTTFNLPNTQGVFLRGAGSQTINARTYTGTLGTKATDTTKKNGLTATAAPSSVTATAASGGGHFHGQRYGAEPWVDFSGTGSSVYGNLTAYSTTQTQKQNITDSAGSHTHSVSGTAAAQAIEVGDGDAETRPANLGINYIIKI